MLLDALGQLEAAPSSACDCRAASVDRAGLRCLAASRGQRGVSRRPRRPAACSSFDSIFLENTPVGRVVIDDQHAQVAQRWTVFLAPSGGWMRGQAEPRREMKRAAHARLHSPPTGGRPSSTPTGSRSSGRVPCRRSCRVVDTSAWENGLENDHLLLKGMPMPVSRHRKDADGDTDGKDGTPIGLISPIGPIGPMSAFHAGDPHHLAGFR